MEEKSEEQKLEEQREYFRTRKRLQREREKEQRTALDNAKDAVSSLPLFKLREGKDTKEPAKKLTNDEAEAALEKMMYIYTNLSGLADDLLEAIVKDHEPVTIWQLTDDEARTLAEFQIENGRRDPHAARVVRTITRAYDKMYMYMLFGPRVVATAKHVKEHQGLSLK